MACIRTCQSAAPRRDCDEQGLLSERQKYDAKGLKQGESIALDNPLKFKQEVVGTTL